MYGKTFAEVASRVYSECNSVILFAILSKAVGSADKILLNPGDSYTCTGDEVAFVIARDRREADAVAKMQKQPDTDAATAAWGAHKSSSLLKDKATASAVRPDQQPQSLQADDVRAGRRRSRLVDWKVSFESQVRLVDKRPTQIEDVVVGDVRTLGLRLAPIVVCVLSPTLPDHLEYLIGPLRVKAIKQHRPIVVVCASAPTQDHFEPIRHFRHVYFVVGDPHRVQTLQRSGLETSRKVVIMGGEGEISEASGSELLADSVRVCLSSGLWLLAF